MSEYLEFATSMTGSTNSGPLQPHNDSLQPPLRSAPFDFYPTSESPVLRGHRQGPSRKMTLTSANGQPIQLTPLWEHVVRTRKFPNEVDSRLTFLEISERLRDPEWEVRQHALRVLIDVLPTLNADIINKVMQPVISELVNNLGHPAPAVRKGVLDALRVFLIHSSNRENIIKDILRDGLNRSEVGDSFQTNVTTGVILSVPSLLFPSSNSPSPNPQLVKDATIALASRLAQVPHQEAVLKSLMKIRDAVGVEEFEKYLEDYDNKLKRNIEILSKIYNVKSSGKTHGKSSDTKAVEKSNNKWESDSDTSGIVEEEDEVNSATMPAARVVLETEIKFNEETAITMTILEEKEDSEQEGEEEDGGGNAKDETNDDPERRKTPRRVHFGGEIVKLRTPDSDDTESLETTPKTRIPLPVSPVTKMPNTRPRPSSQPCSPSKKPGKFRKARSVSNSPKREIYTHNAELSPKKSILTRTGSPQLASKTIEQFKKKKIEKQEEKDNKGGIKDDKNVRLVKIDETLKEAQREEIKLVQSGNALVSNIENGSKSLENADLSKNEKQEVPQIGSTEANDCMIQIKTEKDQIMESVLEKNAEERRKLFKGDQKLDAFFGSTVKNDDADQIPAFVNEDENEIIQKDSSTLSAMDKLKNYDSDDPESLKNVDSEHLFISDRNKSSAVEVEKNESADGEMESAPKEPSWEELGLVDQEVLEDLHNKDDWRARVRGLERVASALRTSSALIAIEPRLGSLLHAVLGCERSCRVAAAGLAVAKVVVAGVSKEALKQRLPQLAWGLARHGGPSAAQLARIAMLRLRPALFLEHLLQPQCLEARNAKTRENTLQLLIFSLVTFPSTEFKVDTVANKIAKMVRDRRRRVRQAALDTLAVLAQIYEPEEVIAAGKRASEGHHDGGAMMSAIRARLARKSLPLVSADGLVMYGLQISPTVQIATGPDIDWIVAGSGSVSSGIGRTKGKIIATRSEKERLVREEKNANYRENPWSERPNFVALGVGMRFKSEQPVVWQMVPTQNQDVQCESEMGIRNDESFNSDIKSRNQTKIPTNTRESTNYRSVIENNLDRKQESNNKTESRIPVLYTKECGPKPAVHSLVMDKSTNSELINVNLKRRLRNTRENSKDRVGSQEEARTTEAGYHPKRKNQANGTSTQYDNYRSTKNLDKEKADRKRDEESENGKLPNDNSRIYQSFIEKDRTSRKSDIKSKYNRSSSIDSHQSRNINQQTFVIHNMYSSSPHRDTRFADENSFRTLETYAHDKTDFNPSAGESNNKNMSRMKPPRKTKDAAAQKITDIEVISSDAQTGEYFPVISADAPYRRRLRSLSPSQLYHRQQFAKSSTNEVRALSTYEIDKAVNEEQYNEKNKNHFLPDESFGTKTLNPIEAKYEVDDYEYSSSDALENNFQDTEQEVQDCQDDCDYRSPSPNRPNPDSAFDVISGQSSPLARDTVDFIISLSQKVNIGANATDDGSREWSSEEELKSKNQSRTPSRSLVENYLEDNRNDSELSTSDETGKSDEQLDHIQERSTASFLTASKNLQTPGDTSISDFENAETLPPSKRSVGSRRSSRSTSRNSEDFDAMKSPRRRSRSSSRKLSFDNKESEDSNEDKVVFSMQVQCDIEKVTFRSHRESLEEESPAIIIASRPHSSTEDSDGIENHEEPTSQPTENDNPLRFVSQSIEGTNSDGQNNDSSSETNTEPGILKIEPQPIGPVATTQRKPSRVPRVIGRSRSRGKVEKTEKLKPIVQQCFAQLEDKDWEITMKGLKTLTQIAKQQPEYLDTCAAGIICRHLGRLIKSLRSQVARTACLAAGDVFASQIRGIDQDFDDVAAPLLHRTADTNRFLRADCNAALDRMIEHLPPFKTITVIVQRGASHQNAIVRAATARLLASVVDRIGPEQTLSLPRDVRDKLLFTGARLLIDGNLDARNHAKRMFRRLVHHEGFRKALVEAVPDTTLRHIEKTLRSL